MGKRFTEWQILAAIITGYDVDRSPETADGWTKIMSEADIKHYRISRNLWMLSRSGVLATEIRGGQHWFWPTDLLNAEMAEKYWKAF